MLRTSIFAIALVLSGCATATEADPETALSGKDIGAAIGIYGPWEQKLVLAGRPTYIWRRQLIEGDARYYCEMMVETGFRNTIARSYMQGFPRACQMFNVRYDTDLK
jgi:hypothetical protein